MTAVRDVQRIDTKNLGVATKRSCVSQTNTSARSESGVETARAAAGSGREYVSKTAPYLRFSIESGAVAAIVGGTGLLGGLRALRGGERERVLARLAFGAAFLAAAVAQRRSRGRRGESDGEETDVVDTGVDSEDLAETTERETEDAGDATETVTETEDVDRLGEAAFGRQSQEVPAPQRAFNQGFLAHSAEAFWGVRTRDDAVLVSQDYDAVEGRDGVQYVASSEIGDDVRELPIPDAVLDHWDEVLGGGTAVTGGDDILFVTTDDLAADGLLRVLPAEWADNVFGEEE